MAAKATVCLVGDTLSNLESLLFSTPKTRRAMQQRVIFAISRVC
jgi:hypothetical protein